MFVHETLLGGFQGGPPTQTDTINDGEWGWKHYDKKDVVGVDSAHSFVEPVGGFVC